MGRGMLRTYGCFLGCLGYWWGGNGLVVGVGLGGINVKAVTCYGPMVVLGGGWIGYVGVLVEIQGVMNPPNA